MKLHGVKSSNIQAIGFDPATKEMHVQFSSGHTYSYHGISEDQHKALINSDSIGGHFGKHIRPKHVGKKLEKA